MFRQHIQPILTSIAVVVQKMVPAEAAGAVFSRHPLNGDPSVIFINAYYGLGESVVSARADPDTFLVKKSYKDDLEILAIKIGHPSVKDIKVDDEKRSTSCLSKPTVLKLAKLVMIMEKFFGTPRDIEFAVTKDEKIYLLQSRPITSLNNFTDYEIIHENDSPVMSGGDMFTRAHMNGIFEGPVSTFSQSTLLKVFDKTVFKNNFGKTTDYSGLYSMLFPVRDHHPFICIGSVSFKKLLIKKLLKF
jgi:Pyruvate phosphate dikinase, AMP/ATP-binding domain